MATRTKTIAQPALFETPAPQAEVIPPATPEKQGRKTAVAVVRDPPAPTNLLAIIASAASNKLVDVDKMRELLKMQREIEQAEQGRAFNRALHDAQAEMPRIVKDRANDHTKSKYATLEAVSKGIDAIVRKHGLVMSFGTADSPLKEHFRIVCDLSHTDGHTRRYFCDLQADIAGSQGKSNKTPIQGVGSTMSYARRYLKVMIFDLTIVGEDNDGNKRREREPPADDAVVLVTAEQITKIDEAIKFCGVGVQAFCKHYSILAVKDLPASAFADALQACKNYQDKKAEDKKKGDGANG